MSGNLNIGNITQKWAGASSSVVSAIQGASAKTGVSFDYLMDKARQESSFDSDAKAKTSSASGLFQFIESTWLNAVKTYGDKFGLGDLSSKITVDSKGQAHVTDAATKQQILKLRDNPEVASNLVAAMTKDNANYLENSLGGKVGETDLYLAHFLGLGGANKFLKAKQANPLASAAELFPEAAKANKNVFYNANGTKRSLDQVYGFFASKMGGNNTVIDQGAANNIMTAQAARPALLTYNPTSSVASINPFNFQMPDVDALSTANWGNGALLDSVLASVQAFSGDQDKQHRLGSGLLSPYTAFVLSKLSSPDEKTSMQEKDNSLFG